MVSRFALVVTLALLSGCAAAPSAPVISPSSPSVTIGSDALVASTSGQATVFAPVSAASTTRWLGRVQQAAKTLQKTNLGALDDDWDGRLVVELPATAAAFTALTGTDPADAAAVTRCLPGADRITINPAVASKGAEYLETLVLHEAVHAATGSSCAAKAPQWVVEGLAEWVASAHDQDSLATNQAWVREYLDRHRVPSGLPPDADFRAEADTVSAAYGLARLAVAEAIAGLGREASLRYFRDAYSGRAKAATTAAVLNRYRAALANFSGSAPR